jgi:hypothetical protein
MAPSDDYWRHTSPWPSHDPQTPYHAPGEPQPQSYSQPPMPLYNPPSGTPYGGGYGGVSGTGGYVGYSGNGGGFWLVAFVIFFWAVPHTLPLLVVLYPLVAAIEVGAARGVFLLVGKLDTGVASTTRLALAAATCLVLLWPLYRVEQRLANIRAYRVVRHLARLALLGLLVYRMTITMPSVEPLPPWMRVFRGVFRSPQQLAVTFGAVAVWHFVLSAAGLRTAWHRALEVVRLRRA